MAREVGTTLDGVVANGTGWVLGELDRAIDSLGPSESNETQEDEKGGKEELFHYCTLYQILVAVKYCQEGKDALAVRVWEEKVVVKVSPVPAVTVTIVVRVVSEQSLTKVPLAGAAGRVTAHVVGAVPTQQRVPEGAVDVAAPLPDLVVIGSEPRTVSMLIKAPGPPGP